MFDHHDLITTAFSGLVFGFLGLTLASWWFRGGETKDGSFNIAFIHPHCNAGGGGERVLWSIILALQRTYPKVKVTIYGGIEDVTDEAIILKAEKTFGIKLERSIKIIRNWTRPLIESKRYPRFTMLFQAIGMFIYGLESIIRFRPDLFIDTEGCPFFYPVLYLLEKSNFVLSYVHYPFITEEVISSSKSNWRKNYYDFIFKSYKFTGKFCKDAIYNSTWTEKHMKNIWPSQLVQGHIIFPPCDLSKLHRFDIESEREPIIFSLSQFRPEKNQKMQLEILVRLFELKPEWREDVRLILCGGCRDKYDFERAEELQKYSKSLGIEKNVKIITNANYEDVLKILSVAQIGLHTMVDEHFGISLVEFMASGLITVANNSGGPRSDIVMTTDSSYGYLCKTIDEYAKTIKTILCMPESSRQEIRSRARSMVLSKFDLKKFENDIISILAPSIICK